MRDADVNIGAVERAIEAMPVEFRTKEISSRPDVKSAHGRHAPDGNYHGTIGRCLSNNQGRFGLSRVSPEGQSNARWRRKALTEGDRGPDPARALPTAAPQPVRRGHQRTASYLASPDFAEVVELFDRWPEIGGTYFRPHDTGVQPVDLSVTSAKPLIGVGASIRAGTTADELEPFMANRIAELRSKRATSHQSVEKQLEARLIREAQRSGLRLAALGSSLRFINSQWRIDDPGAHGLLDVLAVDLGTGGLTIVELKASPEPGVQGQVAAYVDYFKRHARDLTPFFQEIAGAMATLYRCPELAEVELTAGAVEGLVAWPASGAGLHVEPA